ncbi:hypothetical protein [uncultured Mediterranean phage]|nr:hypothetical protein [uncultured Mediterranean phage]
MKKEVYSEVKPIFPTPIFLSVTDKQFSKKEISFLKSKHKSNNILKNKILKDIKKEIVIAIHNYFAAIDQPSNDLNFDIFQSWVEKGIKNKINPHIYQVEQKHSYLTGFLYIKANEKKDVIKFIKDEWSAINVNIHGSNIFNSATWEIPVSTKKIIIFPSTIPYCIDQPYAFIKPVAKLKNKKNMIVIGFNVFLTVKTGKVEDLIKELIK